MRMRHATVAGLLLVAAAASAEDWGRRGQELHEQGKHEEAVTALKKHLDLYPEHVPSYRFLALSLEALGRAEDARQVWQDFRLLARTPDDRALAREKLGIARAAGIAEGANLRLTESEQRDVAKIEPKWSTVESQHFTVTTRNRLLAQIVSTQAERYLVALSNTFLDGTPYPHKVPITIYPDQESYVNAGNSEWSQGGTAAPYESLDMFLAGKRKRRIDLLHFIGGTLNQDLVDPGVLPHELSHLVLMEFFASRRMPLWLNEGIAQNVQSGRREDCDRRLGEILLATPDILMKIDTVIHLDAYPAEMRLISQFYAISASFTGWILDKGGNQRMAALLRAVRDGRSVAQALTGGMRDAGFDTVTAMEASWREGLLEAVKRPPK